MPANKAGFKSPTLALPRTEPIRIDNAFWCLNLGPEKNTMERFDGYGDPTRVPGTRS
jgi:hypothetical protein